MRNYQIGRVAILGMLLLGLTSCIPLSDHPASDIKQAKVDERLLGSWVTDSDDETTTLVFGKLSEVKTGKDVPQGLMHGKMTAVPKKKTESDKNPEPADFAFFVGTIGKFQYISEFGSTAALEKTWDSSKIASEYELFRYKIEGDTLTCYIPSDESYAKAIKSGKIKGTIKYDPNNATKMSSVRLTDSTENIAKYIQDGGGEILFPDANKVEFKRTTKK